MIDMENSYGECFWKRTRFILTAAAVMILSTVVAKAVVECNTTCGNGSQSASAFDSIGDDYICECVETSDCWNVVDASYYWNQCETQIYDGDGLECRRVSLTYNWVDKRDGTCKNTFGGWNCTNLSKKYRATNVTMLSAQDCQP